MGIGGHVLGAVKLRRLARLTGLPLDRAIIRNHYAEGVVWVGAEPYEDVHYVIDPKTGTAERIAQPDHWSSCRTHEV